MLLNNAEEYTWVSYKGKPYFVKQHAHKALIIDSNSNEKRVSYTSIKPIEVPKFKVGEKVLCVDKESPLNGQIVTIETDDNSSFAPYRYGHYLWATPFDLAPVNY